MSENEVAERGELEEENARLRSLVEQLVSGRIGPRAIETFYRPVWQRDTEVISDTMCKTLHTALANARGRAAHGNRSWVESATVTWERVEGTDQEPASNGKRP